METVWGEAGQVTWGETVCFYWFVHGFGPVFASFRIWIVCMRVCDRSKLQEWKPISRQDDWSRQCKICAFRQCARLHPPWSSLLYCIFSIHRHRSSTWINHSKTRLDPVDPVVENLLFPTHRIHGAAIYGAPWIPYFTIKINPSHVSINLPAPWILWAMKNRRMGELEGSVLHSGNKPSFNPRPPARENFPRLLDVQICEVRCSIHPELNGLQWLMDTMPWWFIPPILGDIPGYFRRSRVNQSMLIHLLETKLLKWDEPPSIGKHAIHFVQFLRAWFLSSEKRNATTQEIQLLWRFRQLKYWDNQR